MELDIIHSLYQEKISESCRLHQQCIYSENDNMYFVEKLELGENELRKELHRYYNGIINQYFIIIAHRTKDDIIIDI